MSQKIVHEREQAREREMMIIDELLSYPPTTLLGIFCPRSDSCCFGLVDDWTRLYTVASSSAAAAAVALFLNTHGSHLYRKNIIKEKAGLCWPV